VALTPGARARAVAFARPAAMANGDTLHATFLMNFFDEVRRRAPR
jgi:hypothetical protein